MTRENQFRSLGIVLMFTAILLNPWLIGLIFSPNRKISSLSWIAFIILADLLLFLCGKVIWRQRHSLTYKTLLYGTLTIFLTLGIIEIGLRVVSYLRHPIDGTALQLMHLNGDQDPKKAERFVKEFRQLKKRLTPYRGWTMEEHHGANVNIDSCGIRNTVNVHTDSKYRTVYVMGGSTVWGEFVGDSETIPSHLSRMLNQDGHPTRVMNYGEMAYIFNQDVIYLISLLREGKRPDEVVFYSGVNDVLVTYYYEKEGNFALTNDLQHLLEFYREPIYKQMGVLLCNKIEQDVFLFRVVDKVVQRFYGDQARAFGNKNYTSQEMPTLADGITQDYYRTYSLLQKLAEVYHFKFHCILQPVIYTKGHVTADEAASDLKCTDKLIKQLYLLTYQRIRNLRLENFEDLSTIFENVEGSIYFDFCHISGKANEMVARKIAAIVQNDTSVNAFGRK